jgi:prevent-host-death family protein
VCYTFLMKQVTLREANRQFSKLVREVEETGERVLVLRSGKPAVEIAPARATRASRKLTSEQQAAFNAFVEAALKNPGNSKGVRRWTRNELHER